MMLSTSPSEQRISSKTGRTLLRLVLAAQPIPRIELARRLNINRSTVSEIFKPLIAAGVLCEASVPHTAGSGRAVGRPAVGLSFCSERELFVGVNLGVRRSQVGITTLNNVILAEEDFDTPLDQKAALAQVREQMERLCGRFPDRVVASIGVSVPGPTDSERRRMLYAPRLGWRDVRIADALSMSAGKNLGAVPVIVENDATAAAMYEARLRLKYIDGESLSDFILVRSGTGIGVGLVLAGEVYRGTGEGEGIAGEFGHMTIVAGGKPCVCGNRGCWEQYASASAASSLYMGDRVLMGRQKAPRYVDIVAKAESGELRAQRTLERIGEYLGIGISNVISGLGVPHVIVSGRVVYGWKFLQDSLRQAIGQSMAGKLAEWSVEAGEPTGAGLGGALEVAVEDFLERRFSS